MNDPMIVEALRRWRDIPTPDSAWGLRMKTKIAGYYGVTVEEIDEAHEAQKL